MTVSFLPLSTSVTRKKSPNVYKSYPKIIDFGIFTKNCIIMWEIWANKLLPKALKSCPKSNKSPNLVTLPPWHLQFDCNDVRLQRISTYIIVTMKFSRDWIQFVEPRPQCLKQQLFQLNHSCTQRLGKTKILKYFWIFAP